MLTMLAAKKIHVKGIVQGVGFRPFVYKQAKLHMINGWVLNSADGVHIEAEGEENLLDQFCLSLANDAPIAAQVEEIELQDIPLKKYKNFTIKHSKNETTGLNNQKSASTLISPDLAMCKDCEAELFDKKNKRFHYPFINCTNCGPRFTIIKNLPYDRNKTSMSQFKMCKDCNDEYLAPTDRRFHAQPNACFNCGPYISWVKTENKKVNTENILWGNNLKKSDEIFEKCTKFIKDGKIVAIKGLGGFHIACDACNNNAVQKLREKKQRSNKAFAIMTQNIDVAKTICYVSKTEELILKSPARPIVLLKSKYKNLLAKQVSCGLPEIGIMLPYTPVHHILMKALSKQGIKFVVMTSGNIYDNPIITQDDDAYKELSNVVDAYIGNNRKILSRYDDSVVRVIKAGNTDAIQMIRRARGYAPQPIKLNINNNNFDTNSIFATGAEQKNTFCFLRHTDVAKNSSKFNTEAFVSQHIGDLENAEVMSAWSEAKNCYEDNFKLKTNKIVYDAHPEYLSSKWAQNQETKNKLQTQHHFAHIASVIAENQLDNPVLGFAFDGTGYGADGNIWGGEALLCNTKDYERFANFAYIPMPGGQAAIKNPLQMAYGALWAFDLLDHPTCKHIFKNENGEYLANLNTIIERGINCHQTSSVGRIFDAVSAILGICPNPSYEGESAIMLEAKLWDCLQNNEGLAAQKFDKRYEIQITKNVGSKNSTAHDTSVLLLDAAQCFKAIMDDIQNERNLGEIIKNFHGAIVLAITTTSQLCKQIYGINQIALSGGVFMNRYLIERTVSVLSNAGFTIAINKDVPPNDGGISLGQAFICANTI